MSQIEGYRELYEYERDCNRKMLAMIESVPAVNRDDASFMQAVLLADHLAACRENWLEYMRGDGTSLVPWFKETGDLASLKPRYAALETQWADYLATLDDAQLALDFTFPGEDGRRYAVRTEVQIVQLVGHASYHRGQIALLVDQLSGETVDTDYVDWVVSRSA